MGELVGERLDVIWQQPGDVLNHIVGGGVDAALVPDCDTRKKSYLIKMSVRDSYLTSRPSRP